ncbi:bile acid:sodium symporter family protein [Bacillus marasmi]|uniref:bile acid:sodium symporter family protein n=1 Tax=Bacillus marasmi TaxID=1926279 RepID=UPI0011C73F7C|nr:bile acid:sodium symporter family protein [Bacillus marasmi]
MLGSINRVLERMMPIITPVSVIIGVLLTDELKSWSYLVPWIFAVMTFIGSLGSNFKSLKDVFTHPMRLITVLLILHIIVPLWALLLGHITFSGDIHTITGIVLAAVIPTGITSFIWVSVYKGNAPLALTIILVDTFLSPFIVPYSVSLLAGEKVVIDTFGMMQGLLGMVVIPSLLGMTLHEVTKGKVKQKLGVPLAPFSKIGLAAVVMINSSVVAPYLKNFDVKLLTIAALSLTVSASGYMISVGVGKLLKWGRGDVTTLMFTGGMRNISAGAVIAVAYFEPAVAVPVVIGMLFQQVLASIFGHLLHKSYEKPLIQKQVKGA